MAETKQLIRELSAIHGKRRESLLPILQAVVKKESYLSSECMTEVARELDISAAEVYGTASFYSFLETVPRGRFVIRVCRTIICDMQGKKDIIKTIEDMLKIKLGGTSLDKKFSLLETNCLGWCNKGPVMLINDDVYTELTPEKVTEIIGEYIQKD